MSIFRRKPKAVPLTRPRGTEALRPDARLARDFANEIRQVVATGKRAEEEMLPQPSEDVAPLVAALHRLTKGLADRWWGADTSDHDWRFVIAFERTVLGAAFALSEQRQWGLVPGQVHPFVWQALIWEQTDLPDIPDEVGHRAWMSTARLAALVSTSQSIFALRAGYYLARVGEDATPELVANADTELARTTQRSPWVDRDFS